LFILLLGRILPFGFLQVVLFGVCELWGIVNAVNGKKAPLPLIGEMAEGMNI